MKLLIFTDWYSPAFKAGGPVRSIVNFVDTFKDKYEIYILTSDRDLNDLHSFNEVVIDTWIDKDGYKIFYASPAIMKYTFVKKLIKGINPDKIYLNSMFSIFTIYPLLGASNSGKIVLAPRGMLRCSALQVKPIKKYLFLTALRTFNIAKDIVFHSTGAEESKDILQIFPMAVKIIEAPNLPVHVGESIKVRSKSTGELKIIFVGRMHPIKNLLFLLQCLEHIHGNVSLKIIVTNEDHGYWLQCEEKILMLHEKISIDLLFDIPHDEIKKHLESAHLFVLPTKGENFGHAIFESMAVGCPVLISDQTPWQNLEINEAGVELNIDNMQHFSEAIQRFIDMDNDSWNEFSEGAHAMAKKYEAGLQSDLLYSRLFT